MKRMRLICLLFFATSIAIHAENSTVIRITDKVLVKDTVPLGVHMTEDNYYDSALLKVRATENFEGAIRRLHVNGSGEQNSADGLLVEGSQMIRRLGRSENEVDADKDNLALARSWVGAEYTILSGTDLFQTGKVVAVEAPATKTAKGTTFFLRLDRPHRWHPEMNGLLLDNSKPGDGVKVTVEKGKAREPRGSEGNELIKGDTRPGGFGQNAYLLKPATKPAFFETLLQFDKAMPLEGKWIAEFWAKAKSGQPTVSIGSDIPGTPATVRPGKDWQLFKTTFSINSISGKDAMARARFEVTGGDVVIDDIIIYKDEPSSNTTAFRDPVVDTLKQIHPGVMRRLRNVASTINNNILPAERSLVCGDSAEHMGYGDFEFYELCEAVGAEPFNQLPGTIKPEEIDQFMEYLSAPADTGMGKLRAELGHPKPWTQSFKRIHIQFGNEVSTFPGTGYCGPDYWQALIARAKASPYFSSNVLFHVNDQGASTDTILSRAPNADYLTIEGYTLFRITPEQVKKAGDRAGFYDFLNATIMHRFVGKINNTAPAKIAAARKYGMELSMYEGQVRPTFGGGTPMIDEVQAVATGMAGGLNAANLWLLQLKLYGMRFMNDFNFSQSVYSAKGTFGDLPISPRFMGGVINLRTKDSVRIRPRYLCMAVANRVIEGDLVETEQSGFNPKITISNDFGTGFGNSRNPKPETLENIPLIYSYAFKNGTHRGLILVNANPHTAEEVVLEFPGQVAGGKCTQWRVASDNLDANNEPDWSPAKPGVNMEESAVENFQSGYRATLPKASITSFKWESAEK